MTSQDPLPGRCNAMCRNGEYCENYPVDDAARCRMHGGAADNRGEKNGNYKHGAFSEHLREELTEREEAAIGDVVDRLEDDESAADLVRELVGEAIIKYQRSGNVRFLTEIRQLIATFNLADATDRVDVRSRHSEIAYTVVREGEDEPLPTVDAGVASETGAGETVDYEAIGFTSGPATVDVEAAGGERGERDE